MSARGARGATTRNFPTVGPPTGTTPFRYATLTRQQRRPEVVFGRGGRQLNRAPVAQWIEHRTSNPTAAGSNPAGCAIKPQVRGGVRGPRRRSSRRFRGLCAPRYKVDTGRHPPRGTLCRPVTVRVTPEQGHVRPPAPHSHPDTATCEPCAPDTPLLPPRIHTAVSPETLTRQGSTRHNQAPRLVHKPCSQQGSGCSAKEPKGTIRAGFRVLPTQQRLLR